MTEASIGTRVLEAQATQATLCVGIDPHAATLDSWGLPDDASGAESFAKAIRDAVVAAGVSVVKPQVALFERMGLSGLRVLSQLMSELREAGIGVIADVKRGDIGSSLQGYADAWLRPGSDFEADAMTAVAYQGLGSLRPAFDLAAENGKTVFVLSATSNPEGADIQQATTDSGNTVAGEILTGAQALVGANPTSRGTVGVVIGATVNHTTWGIDAEAAPDIPILAPGFGHQGVTIEQAPGLFGKALGRVLVTASRSVAGDSREGLDTRMTEHLKAVADATV